MRLLFYLRESGPTNASVALENFGPSRDGFYNAVERLRSLGYLYADRQPAFPARVLYALTEKGEEVADRLRPLADLLKETRLSMESELASLDRDDKPETMARRIELLGLLADESFHGGEWDSAISHATRQLDLARQSGDSFNEIVALLTLGRLRQKRDEGDAADGHLKSAHDLAVRTDRFAFASDSSLLRGALTERRGELESAGTLYDEALHLAQIANDETRMSLAQLARGRLLGRRGRLDESYAILTEVVTTLERLRETEELPRAYANLGTTAFYLNRPEALDWYEKAIEAALRVGDVRIEAYGLSNAAAYLIEKREFRKAKTNLNRARTIFENLGEKTMIGGVELNSANLLAAQGKWRDAEHGFNRALELAREAKNRFQEATALLNMGQMEKRRGRPEEAKDLLTRARDLFRAIDSRDRARRCEEELASL